MLHSFSRVCTFTDLDTHAVDSAAHALYTAECKSGLGVLSDGSGLSGRLVGWLLFWDVTSVLALTFDRISWLQQFSENQGGFVTQTCRETHTEKSSRCCDACQSNPQTLEDAAHVLLHNTCPHVILSCCEGTFETKCFLGSLFMHFKSLWAWHFLLWLSLEAIFLNPDPGLPPFPFVFFLYL